MILGEVGAFEDWDGEFAVSGFKFNSCRGGTVDACL